MKNQHKNTEPYYINKIVSRYSESEAISAMNRRIKQLELENGELKSENARLEHLHQVDISDKKGLNKKINELQNSPVGVKLKLKLATEKIINLEHQLLANGIPLPKKYQ